MAEIKGFIRDAAPKLDGDLLDYVSGYFEDASSDRTSEGLFDFLEPILSECGSATPEIQELCDRLAALTPAPKAAFGYGVIALDGPLVMSQTGVADTFRSEVGDFRHTQSSSGPKGSTVDQRKLRAAEKKLAEKNAKRGLYDPDAIPVWNPDVKPAIIVNQMKVSSQTNMSKDIKLENFDIAFAGKKILQNADLSLVHGRRYGLVGKNGVGKSTLLRAIAHEELRLPAHIRVLHVEQEIAGDDTPALQSVLDADLERNGLLEEEKKLNQGLMKISTTPEEGDRMSKRLKEVYAKLEDIEADKAESKASAILNGLGFTPDQQRAATRTFSGGWRMRLALARALFCKPDLLLADEVTNYLDFPAVVWLEKYFQQWPATLLVVSHDRSFLDAVSTDILHLHDGLLDYYRGNFSVFVGTKAERRRNQIREYEAQLSYRNHLQDFIDRWRYNAKRAAQAQSKIKLLEKLPPLNPPPKDDMEGIAGEGADILFRFPDPEKLSPPILRVNDIKFGYTPERVILDGVSFDLQMDSKIAVVGPNGAGKSTLIKLMTAGVEPQKGIVDRHGRLRVALFSQHHVDQLELGASSVQFLQSKFPGMQEEEYRRVLGRYGLTGTTALQPIGTLSGGQKSRAVFAWMAMMNPHVLILDEPTNHLDMDSIDALASALRAFKGGIAIVSHDERFLDAVCTEVWQCSNGKLEKFEGKAGVQDGVVKQYKTSLMIDES
ncbi:ATP-binding cassette sub- F member 3 [Geranomyces variabilis]|nr:ATP-binding cassette sub- F member 3 [Geranomyces variabilis]